MKYAYFDFQFLIHDVKCAITNQRKLQHGNYSTPTI